MEAFYLLTTQAGSISGSDMHITVVLSPNTQTGKGKKDPAYYLWWQWIQGEQSLNLEIDRWVLQSNIKEDTSICSWKFSSTLKLCTSYGNNQISATEYTRDTHRQQIKEVTFFKSLTMYQTRNCKQSNMGLQQVSPASEHHFSIISKDWRSS